ncbi:MAG TPA: shikimate dehydrogenase [Allosphingosinicella sp.]|jgi:shikimate dehydrogenase|nr:shikimate dehydrogenase [Allosphingosinicella sp.]
MGIPYAEVIGDPIAHSKSPIIHRFWLKGISADYRATRVSEGELDAYFEERRRDEDWLGCNVTRPHKQAVLEVVDRVSGPLRSVGAANFIQRREDGLLTASNFDIEAVRVALEPRALHGTTVAVVGAGGAARAAVAALKELDVAEVVLIARNQAKAQRILTDLDVSGRTAPFSAPLPRAAALVNASPLGQTGEPPLELDLDPLPANALVFDMVYSPLDTDLLQSARRRGLKTVDGLTMLIEQAAISFEMFFEVVLDRSEDRRLRELLTR